MQMYLEPVELVVFVKPIISPTWGQRSTESWNNKMHYLLPGHTNSSKETLPCPNVYREPSDIRNGIFRNSIHRCPCLCKLSPGQRRSGNHVRCNDPANKRNAGILRRVFFVVVNGSVISRTAVCWWIRKIGRKMEARYNTLIVKWHEQKEQGHLTQIQELSLFLGKRQESQQESHFLKS